MRWTWFEGSGLGDKITADGDCSREIKRHLLFRRKSITSLDSVLKTRDITLPTKVHLVKAMVFPVVMYGCAPSPRAWRPDFPGAAREAP